MKNIITLVVVVAIAAVGFFFFKGEGSVPISVLGGEGEVQVEAALSPEVPKAGEETTVTFTFTNEDGSPASRLMPHHARRVHVLAIPENLESLGHVHPNDFAPVSDAVISSGVYSVNYTFPESGKYILAVDVQNHSGATSKQFEVNVGGSPRMSKGVSEDFSLEKCFIALPEQISADRYVEAVFAEKVKGDCSDDYQVTLTPSADTITAGESVELSYHIMRNGEPVTDLQPFLDAALHLAIVPVSFETVLHRHGVVGGSDPVHMDHSDSMEMEDSMSMSESDQMEMDDHLMEENSHSHGGGVPASFGPNLISERIEFPRAGVYRVFGQFKHDGKIVFSSFMISVGEGFDDGSAKNFELNVMDGALHPSEVSVTEGDQVVLHIESNSHGEFHIAGYEIEKDLVVGSSVELRFTANQAGRYNLELHPEGTEDDIEIGSLVVNPR